jgi:hypothetical protein
MSQKLFDTHKVDSDHDQMAGEGMPQVMKDKALNPGLSERSMKALADVHQPMPRLAREYII